MSAYHATHASPYDDACPDCTGFHDLDLTDQSTHAAGLWATAVVVCFALMALIGGAAFVMSRVR